MNTEQAMTAPFNAVAHTPGPWKFTHQSVDPEWWIVTNDCGVRLIANVLCESGRDMADIRLITAAPDLLAACQYVAEFDATAMTKEQMATIGKRVRAAIAKATEGQS